MPPLAPETALRQLDGPMSDDAALVDLIPQIVPSASRRQAMLVDNPAKFFGLDKDA